MRRLAALADVLHPGPSLATVAAALLCLAALTGGRPPRDATLELAAALALQQFAISAHNDYVDRTLDATAKPWRALPAGVLRPRTTLLLAAAFGLGALVIATPLGFDEVVLVALGLSAGLAYNARLKRTPLSWLPFAVAFPLIPLFGMAALDRWPSYWSLTYVVVSPAAVAIHLWDSLPDVELDRRHGVRGLAATLGPNRARRAAWLLAGAALFIAADIAWLIYLLP